MATGEGKLADNAELARLPADDQHEVIVFLLEYRNALERDLLGDKLAALNHQRTRHVIIDAEPAAVRAFLDSLKPDSQIWLQPVRVCWLARARSSNLPRLRDVFFGEPGIFRQHWIARRRPDQIHLVAGDGAMLTDLQAAFKQTNQKSQDLATLAVRRARVALERAERVLRGARYKIARLLVDDIFGNDVFQEALQIEARNRHIPVSDVQQKAERYLREMGALQTPFTLDLMTTLERKVLAANHDPNTDVIPAELEQVAALMRDRPVVFLISHKSMLDIAALLVVLYDANLPMPLTFGGINLNTPGFGAIARRAGVIFLRRSFQDNEIYKLTFKRYIDYLIEKRFSLQWALEGTRSRTGKLLPPRFGLFNYVVESIVRTGTTDVAFVPVSVGFDQITEVADYAREQRGHAKKKEGATWFFKFFKRKAPHGRIFVRFGESIAVTDIVPAKEIDVGLSGERKTELVQSLAFRAAVNLNSATPITTSAIIALILLAGGKRAQSLDEIRQLARAGSAIIRRRKHEIVGQADFKDPAQVLATLRQLSATGIVSEHSDARETLYSISTEQHHNAAYYRNTAIHFFILDGIVEVALLLAAAEDAPEACFFERAVSLRELLKFEFYFPRRADYQSSIEHILEQRFKNWRDHLADPDDLRAALSTAQPLLAHAVLRSFVDAYRIVARALSELHDNAVEDEQKFIDDCLPLGRQMLLQGRVFSDESVSKVLFQTAMKLARHRDLTTAGKAAERSGLLEELRVVSGALQQILDMTLASAANS